MDAIEDYIDTKLDQGFTLAEIQSIFQSPILPNDLAELCAIMVESDIRLCAQRAISIRKIKAFEMKSRQRNF